MTNASGRFVDTLLEASKADSKGPFVYLKTHNDLIVHMPQLVRLLNGSRELGLQFLADPYFNRCQSC